MGILTEAAIMIDPALMMVQAGMEPDPWQARILRNRYHRLILNCSRQSGKTTVIASDAMNEALYNPPSLTLILGPTERQSKELIRTADRIRQSLGISVNPEAQTTTSMEFRNGSRIVAFPAKEQNIRGLAAVTLLIIDEASRVPDDLYYAVLPMLSVSQGRLALLSTPFGKRGFFHAEWTNDAKWERIKVTTNECSRHKPEFLAEMKAKVPANWYAQEYMCEFADTDDALFRYEDVMQAITDEVKPLFSIPTLESPAVKPLFLS